jgi:hypothetical protein
MYLSGDHVAVWQLKSHQMLSNKRVQSDAAAAAGNRGRNWVMYGGFELKHTSVNSRRG